jgi:spore coat polysaccharide biosynthesis protein SpsF
VVREHIISNSDYTSNTVPPTYPDGLDVEVVTMTALQRAWKYARLRSEREHVTLYMKNNANEFRCTNVKARKDMSHLRWTVDEKEDLEFVREVYAALRLSDQEISLNSVLRLIEQQPHLGQINKGIGRDEGLGKSLKEDSLFERS